MTYNINKELLLEAITLGKDGKDDLIKEIRYTLDMTDATFNRLPPKTICRRTDWFFDTYRIRHFEQKKLNIFSWQKISNASKGLVNKKIEQISPIKEISKLDNTCKIKLVVDSKRPIVDGYEMYIEKVTAYKNGKAIKTIYSTEVETKLGQRKTKDLLKISGITNLQNKGNKSLVDLF